jgi:hypothetical protein
MAAKKYALVSMEEEDLGPARVEKKKEKRRHGEKASSSRRDKSHRERSRSPRRESVHRSKTIRRRDNGADFEDRWGDVEYSSEEEQAEFEESVPKRMKVNHDKGEENISDDERERRRDQAEKEAFAKRLQSKDADKTKKIVEDRSSTRDGNVLAQRRALAEDAAARSAALPDLRERSRQEYLTKRERERLALLR